MRICRTAIVVLAVCLTAWAAAGYTVEQIKSFIKSAVEMKTPDKQVADFVRKMKMAEHLDLDTVETLQGEGAGPKTVAALKDLANESNSLPTAPPPPPKPVVVLPAPPPTDEIAKVLDEVREYALNYSKTLPDFICLEQTRRYVDTTGRDAWRSVDVVVARLSYFDQKEDYKLVSDGEKLFTNADYRSVGGALSMGDFGTTMREIFEHASNTHFEYERWGTLRKHRMYVFTFQVPLEYSKYSIHYQGDEKDPGQTIIVGYHGLVFVDHDTHMVMRIVVEGDNIPPAFPVQSVKETLDYDFTMIGDREFLLPLIADVRMHSTRLWTKNVKEFRMYRKFSADTVIKFDGKELPPLPDDQTKEQPPEQQPKPEQPPK